MWMTIKVIGFCCVISRRPYNLQDVSVEEGMKGAQCNGVFFLATHEKNPLCQSMLIIMVLFLWHVVDQISNAPHCGAKTSQGDEVVKPWDVTNPFWGTPWVWTCQNPNKKGLKANHGWSMGTEKPFWKATVCSNNKKIWSESAAFCNPNLLPSLECALFDPCVLLVLFSL